MAIKVIILLGLKHSGKSTLGKTLATQLGYEFVDTDTLIEEAVGMSVRDLYNQQGAAAFLETEEKVCKDLADSIGDRKMVISTGGGICDNPPALVHLKAVGEFIFLQNDLNISISRIVRKIETTEDGKFTNVPAFIAKQNPESIMDIKKMLRARFEEREELYKKISDKIVLLEDASIEANLSSLLYAVR